MDKICENCKLCRWTMADCAIFYADYPARYVECPEFISEETEKICKNCKWWDAPLEMVDNNVCIHPKIAPDIDNEEYRDTATPTELWIETGPEFGCIHWEQE